MSAGQIAAPHGRIRVPIVIALLVGAFAVGGLAGVSLPRAAGSSSRVDATAGIAAAGTVPGAARPALPGVAVNNMSDAADGALAGTRGFGAVAVNNMSDAAARALAGAPAAVPGVAVNNMSDAAARALAADNGWKPFHLAKVCDTATHCVVTSSSFKAIPAGTEIDYSGPDADHLVAVLKIKNGSATGRCAIGSIFGDPSVPGTCRFDTGTGRLTQFHLTVAVTFDGSSWFWDGTYWFGDGGRTG
jgi:hypothetical protein